jgi:signal transduction histidine kinase
MQKDDWGSLAALRIAGGGMEPLRHLMLSNGFLPHGYCYLWTPGLVELHVVSDSLIAISYLTIPVTLVYFIRKRRDIPFSWMFLCFGAFIVACGATHLMEVWTIWVPTYWLAGAVKAFTACMSVATAILLIRVTPQVLALPGTRWLTDLNQKLTAEVEQRAQAESQLQRFSEGLKMRVAERTAELMATNQSLRESEEEIQKLNADLERRVAERTAQMETANRDLESFTYSVSHDLRAPLRHMDGFSKILMEDYGPHLPPGALPQLERIRAATLHMGHLVDDMLNLARVGRGALSLRPTDLNDLVTGIITSLEAETSGRAVDWRVDRLSPVECDPGLMRQVFSNLLSNALKFTRPREKALIEIGETCADGEPVIFVRDNGVGFDQRYADKLFQVFQRLHREEEFEGTGVGLAIVYRILQKHGGSIRAESATQKGATFFFRVRCPLPAGIDPVLTLGGAM